MKGKGEGDGIAHIDPDPLGLLSHFAGARLLRLGLKLRRHQRQHILATLQKSGPCGVIDTGLGLVE